MKVHPWVKLAWGVVSTAYTVSARNLRTVDIQAMNMIPLRFIRHKSFVTPLYKS